MLKNNRLTPRSVHIGVHLVHAVSCRWRTRETYFPTIPGMYVCPIPNGFLDRAISLYSSKIVNKKEISRTVSNTYLLTELSPS
jgi:hypothetical protein